MFPGFGLLDVVGLWRGGDGVKEAGKGTQEEGLGGRDGHTDLEILLGMLPLY